MDFVVHIEQDQPYDDEVRALGSRILRCPFPASKLFYARNFRRILCSNGPYDIVHSHVHHFSGLVLRLAAEAGIPMRIVHSHNDTSSIQAQARPLRRGYYALMERAIHRYASVGLAASRLAAAALFGRDWECDARWRVLHYGIDLAPFERCVDRDSMRANLRIPAAAFVLGHVGRFVDQKNHAFLVDIAAAVAAREPRMHLLLVGDGPLRPAIERKVAQLGLEDRVTFAGLRTDVPSLMLGAMDVFVMPSFYEGLPVVGIEAQAAGLPFILSDVISEETDCVTPLLRRLSPVQSPSAWADAVLGARGARAVPQDEALSRVKCSTFNIHTSVQQLKDVYHGGATGSVHEPTCISPGARTDT
jgi:glycosyltransferase involved in cell wall biosynthesis